MIFQDCQDEPDGGIVIVLVLLIRCLARVAENISLSAVGCGAGKTAVPVFLSSEWSAFSGDGACGARYDWVPMSAGGKCHFWK